RDLTVTGVQTCALPISDRRHAQSQSTTDREHGHVASGRGQRLLLLASAIDLLCRRAGRQGSDRGLRATQGMGYQNGRAMVSAELRIRSARVTVPSRSSTDFALQPYECEEYMRVIV